MGCCRTGKETLIYRVWYFSLSTRVSVAVVIVLTAVAAAAAVAAAVAGRGLVLSGTGYLCLAAPSECLLPLLSLLGPKRP